MTVLAYCAWVTAHREKHTTVSTHRADNKEELDTMIADQISLFQGMGATAICVEYGEITKSKTLELRWTEK